MLFLQEEIRKQMKDIHYETEQKKKNPGFLLSAVSSNSGKTAAACGLMAAFQQKGKCVCGCKCGPDYIDPMFHREVLGVDSKNLDLFFSDAEELKDGYLRHTSGADLTITEGVMGFYDGMALDSVKASSYDVARTLDLPVILVINARGAAMTLAAVIKGIAEFQADSKIRGVLLNRVSAMLYPRLKSMLEAELERIGHEEIKVVGYMPEDEVFHLESRHLGLVTPQEMENLQEKVKKAGEILTKTVDLELLEQLAGEVNTRGQGEKNLLKTLRSEEKEDTTAGERQEESADSVSPVRIAVARDEAFCFYYKDNLELLERMGCELVEFSPLHDERLPEKISGILLGGGYPELYGKQLSENQSMLNSIREALDQNCPCLAECGGFMYLHEEMEDEEGNVWNLIGRMKGRTYPKGKLVRFGYVNVNLLPGETIRAHEFHYWDSTDNGSDCLAVKPDGKRQWECMHLEENLVAGYPHLYYPSCEKFAERFVEKCRSFAMTANTFAVDRKKCIDAGMTGYTAQSGNTRIF